MFNPLYISQTLDIVTENPDKFTVVAMAAGSNVTLLADQVIHYLNYLNYDNSEHQLSGVS